MLEPKAQNEIEDPVVVAKKNAALEWCKHASDYAKSIVGKPWKYVLIPHSNILENMTLGHLVKQFETKG
jgi:type III restriction enzyme